MPLLHSGSFPVSSRSSVLSGFLVRHRLCFVHYACVLHSGSFCLPRSTISLGPNFPEDVSLSPCHCCTTGHLPAGGSQLPPGSTIFSGHFLGLSASPCSCMTAPVPLLHCSRRFHCDLLRRALPMFHCGFHVFRIKLLIVQTRRRRYLAGHCLFSTILHVLCLCINYGSQFRLAKFDFFSQFL
jgi:hypothetical protein